MIHELIEHADKILIGLAAMAGVVIPLWIKIQRESRKWKHIYDVSIEGILKSIKLNINHVCKCADDEKLHTLGITIDRELLLRPAATGPPLGCSGIGREGVR